MTRASLLSLLSLMAAIVSGHARQPSSDSTHSIHTVPSTVHIRTHRPIRGGNGGGYLSSPRTIPFKKHKLSLRTSMASDSAMGSGVQVPVAGKFSEFYMYWISARVGTPSKTYTVTIDTGSSDFLVPRIGCTTCAGDPSTFYSVDTSTTGANVSCPTARAQGVVCKSCSGQGEQCELDVDYGGSILESAVLVEDIVTIAGLQATSQFGAVYNISMAPPPSAAAVATPTSLLRPHGPLSLLYQQQQQQQQGQGQGQGQKGQVQPPVGMFGLAYQKLAAGKELGPLDAYAKQGLIADKFSMCVTADGGLLMLGGDLFADKKQYKYTPIIDETFYTVSMSQLSVGGVTVPVPSSTYNLTIVDSGTPWPNVPMTAWKAMQDVFTQYCQQHPLVGVCTGLGADNKTIFDQTCFPLTAADIAAYPTVTFHLGQGLRLDFTPQHYLQPQYYCQGTGQVGLGISGDQGFTVIGAEMLQQYSVVYDRGNARVGFAPVSDDECRA